MRNIGIVLAELAGDRGITRAEIARALGVTLDDVMFLADPDHGSLEKPAAAGAESPARHAVELFFRNPTNESYVAACKAMMNVIPE